MLSVSLEFSKEDFGACKLAFVFMESRLLTGYGSLAVLSTIYFWTWMVYQPSGLGLRVKMIPKRYDDLHHLPSED